MPKSWEVITPVTPELKAALDALHPEFIKEVEAGGRKVCWAKTVQTSYDLSVVIRCEDTDALTYANLDRIELRKLGAKPGDILGW